MDERPLLGIDFGTSYSTMCWWNPRTSAPEVIRNEHGEEKTPSVVYRSRDGSVLVGQPAADRLGEIAHLPPDEQAERLAREADASAADSNVTCRRGGVPKRGPLQRRCEDASSMDSVALIPVKSCCVNSLQAVRKKMPTDCLS